MEKKFFVIEKQEEDKKLYLCRDMKSLSENIYESVKFYDSPSAEGLLNNKRMSNKNHKIKAYVILG